jgi:bifunctional non-homologous end joining protein LigD
MSGTRIAVDVEGRQVVLSNLDKVLYPAVGFTKGQVLDYYTRIAPVLLPHLAGRALTRKRYPDGVEGQVFFEKNAPRGTPEWVRTVTLPTPGSSKGRETIDFVVVDDLATLVWTANLASLELHTHMWRVDRTRPTSSSSTSTPARRDDRRVLPRGRPAAPAARGRRLVPYAKTSGSKGLQLYARADGLARASRRRRTPRAWRSGWRRSSPTSSCTG